MKKQVIAFICIIVFNFEAIFASTDFSFKRYQVEDGLSHNTTWCSIQDSYGFLWIGTSDGLNCYSMSILISAPVFTGMYLSERVFRTAWCNSDPTIFIKAGTGVRDIIIPTVF